MNDIDRARVKRIVVDAGFPAKDVEWMAAACPDVDTARRYYCDDQHYYAMNVEPLKMSIAANDEERNIDV